MQKWQYAIVVEELDHIWTLWLQEQSGNVKKLIEPSANFESDLSMLSHMSLEGWELVTNIQLHDNLPRLIFKRHLNN